MFQKSLAVLLMGSWISFSGANLVEDLYLDLPRQANLHSPGKEFLPAGDAANEVPESEAFRSLDHAAIFDLGNVSSQLDGPIRDKRFAKIHKLLRVFLI